MIEISIVWYLGLTGIQVLKNEQLLIIARCVEFMHVQQTIPNEIPTRTLDFLGSNALHNNI